MDRNQINKIVENSRFPGSGEKTEIAETHISWIILAEDFVYKIKKPVKLSFLDFSTLEKRKYYCGEELTLNRRLEPEMYLDVLPVTDDFEIVEQKTDAEVIDYALKMKRMDNEKEMSRLLARNEVTNKHIDKLAKKIATFHKNAQVLKNAFGTLEFHEKYADIENQVNFIKEKLGKEFATKIEKSIDESFKYLNAIRSFSNERVISGSHRDCHGDLNSRNIFLYEKEPVVFDCIEFNPEYRQIDVLNDIAFLCVDLDFFGKEDLSREFYLKYLTYSGYNDKPKTKRLFNYYKSYRANIRAKISLINAEKRSNNDSELSNLLTDAKKYISLMSDYMISIKN